jgi:hypothetical protein
MNKARQPQDLAISASRKAKAPSTTAKNNELLFAVLVTSGQSRCA